MKSKDELCNELIKFSKQHLAFEFEDVYGTEENCYKNYQKSLGKDEVGGSNPPSSSKMNDPTQFEQVDETCGLSRVILCLKSLDVTAFLRIDAPWKI